MGGPMNAPGNLVYTEELILVSGKPSPCSPSSFTRLRSPKPVAESHPCIVLVVSIGASRDKNCPRLFASQSDGPLRTISVEYPHRISRRASGIDWRAQRKHCERGDHLLLVAVQPGLGPDEADWPSEIIEVMGQSSQK
ncbi:hypothetical protein PoB_002923500 [Plakobranchus ocellatus]|uniref:Uncharacterized protein n=1 Tax=Plakobranchus ocellatus TaxID=259542 RepID=A0AAV4A7C4_9GAST|nr:hypothetical protein PoB_002923500 [Plakobranchus ocellatus]